MGWSDASVPMNVDIVEKPGFVPVNPPKGEILVFTDGSCWPNPGPGGIGVVLKYEKHTKKISEAIEEQTTNNRAELTAVLVALRSITDPSLPVHMYIDSQYALSMMARGWNVNKNEDLVSDIRLELRRFKKITVYKIRGHRGHTLNEVADSLASAGRQEASKILRRMMFEGNPPNTASEFNRGVPFSKFMYKDGRRGVGFRLYKGDSFQEEMLKVSVVIDLDTGDLLRHGNSLKVRQWFEEFKQELVLVDASDCIDSCRMFTSSCWFVDTLNALLCAPDYTGYRFLKDNGIKI